jgi:hypothetical protein
VSSSVPAFALTRLEVLDLEIFADPEALKYFNPSTSTFPNLRLLSIGYGYGEVGLTQLIITSSAKSTERVNWMYSPSQGTTYGITPHGKCIEILALASLIALEVVGNLRFLTFTTDRGFELDLASVAKYLRNRSITKSLTELTIGLFFRGG